MQITKKQHYVWRFYLRPWTDSKETIACCRNDKVFRSDLMGVGQENYFYKFVEISDTEAWWIEKIALNGNEPDLLKEMCINWINTYRAPFQAINALKKIGISNEEEFDKFIKEGEEKAYCATEKIGKPYLENIYKEDLSFYDNFDDKSGFNIFLCEQFFRTKKRYEAVNSSSKHGIDTHKLWPVFKHIFATKLAFNITYRTDKKFKLFLLHNKTGINFITGDQPVINRYATKELQGKPINNFEFYYPITPKLALLLTEKNYSNDELYVSDETIITELNDLIFYNSQEQVYAVTKNELDRYKNLTRN